MRGMILVAVCMGAIAVAGTGGSVAVATAAADGRSVQSVTVWVGTVGGVPATQPSPWDAAHRPNLRLTISGTTITAKVDGYTGATHDPGSARTTCTSHYQLVKRVGPSSIYRQIGAVHWLGDYVSNAPCEFRRGTSLTTTLAGSKLRADFGLWDEGGHPTYWRGYLRRA